jgi:hypothetical protein
MANINNYNRRDPFQNLRDREESLRRNRGEPEQIIPVSPVRNNGIIWSSGLVGNIQSNPDITFQQLYTQDPAPQEDINMRLHEYQQQVINQVQGVQWQDELRGLYTNPNSRSRPYKAPRPNPFLKEYEAWKLLNRIAKKDDLNSKLRPFKLQSLKSIELVLLNAIASGQSLKTKTTEFNASDFTVKLHNELIAKIDKDSFAVTEIRKPAVFTEDKQVNLFRLRLRQLGLRCVVIKKKDRLYLNEKEYVILTPGKELEIPAACQKNCLPVNIQKKNIAFEDAVQLTLDLGGIDYERVELREYDWTQHPYACFISLVYNRLDHTDIYLEVNAEPTRSDYEALRLRERLTFDDWNGPFRGEHIKNLKVVIDKKIRDGVSERAKADLERYKRQGLEGLTSTNNNSTITWTNIPNMYTTTAATTTATVSNMDILQYRTIINGTGRY